MRGPGIVDDVVDVLQSHKRNRDDFVTLGAVISTTMAPGLCTQQSFVLKADPSRKAYAVTRQINWAQSAMNTHVYMNAVRDAVTVGYPLVDDRHRTSRAVATET